ncbi:MAG: hypothetical protein R3D68_05595 [Hyphomicrobiaceae bacterium]
MTLVHGTFARGAAWAGEGSLLRRELAAALDAARGPITFDVFDWSGQNTHKARVRAGYELASHIRRIRKKNPGCRHFIVAHSHGGNVALLAHKHLPVESHALGIATLGTPFIRAELDDRLAGKSLQEVEENAARHTDHIASAAFWIVGLLAAVTFDHALSGVLAGYRYVPFLLAILTAFLARNLVRWFWPPLARRAHRLSGRRAAAKLANAVALAGMPQTHVISFIYPGDEAARLLDTLEATTLWPSRAIRWVKGNMAKVSGVFWLVLLAGGFAAAIIPEVSSISREAIGDAYANAMGYWFVIGAFLVWILSGSRYVMSVLRGHPWGFGWERPSMHAYVDVYVEPTADLPLAKSYIHEMVPFTPRDDAKQELRHSGLYEDNRILKALSYWMSHVP